jgi:polyisoprenyl-teichoic acid--peptidoglycan teichoic acid transferase
MVPGDFSRAEEFEASYWLPDQRKLDAMVAQYFGTEPQHSSESSEYASGDASGATADSNAVPYRDLQAEAETLADLRVAIQDSTGQLDGAKLLKKLGDAGYESGFLDQPWSQPLQVTQIIAQQGDGEAAEAIGQALGFGEVAIESTGNLESNITIRVGKDALGKITP